MKKIILTIVLVFGFVFLYAQPNSPGSGYNHGGGGNQQPSNNPTPGAIAASQTICYNTAPATITSNIDGTGSGTISYIWEASINAGVTWIPISGAVTSTYSPGALTITTKFRRTTVSVYNATTAYSLPTAYVLITVNPQLNLNCSHTDVTINGGNNGNSTAIVSGGTPAYTYLWSNGQTNATATGLIAGTYTVTVTDAKGCITTCSQTLSQPDALTVNLTSSNVTCNGANNGSISSTVSGGVTPYTYLWSNGATTANITNVIGGTYTVTVTDHNGAIVSAFAIINQPSVALTASIVGTNVLCYGNSTGAADLTVSGGTGTYTYSWVKNSITIATTEDLTGITVGNYAVTVTDANNCTKTATVTITEPNVLYISQIARNDLTCYENSTGNITLTVTGGTGSYTYTWDKNSLYFASTKDITGLQIGNYSVTVTDANGCSAMESSVVSQPDLLIAVVGTKTDVSCYGLTNGAIDLTVTGGTPGYTYTWLKNSVPFATSQDLSGISVGNYDITVSDIKGCTSTTSVSITQPSSAITATIIGTNVLCYGNSTGSADLTVTGGTATYTYLWSNAATSEDISNLVAGTYTVTVTDANGCQTISSATINHPAAALSASITGTNIACNGNTNGSADLTVTGGTATYTYLWSNAATTEDISGLTAGTYTVTITDANSCQTTTSVSINQSASLLTASIVGTDNLCYGNSTGSADLTVAGGTATYTYLWSNAATTEDISNLTAGTYTVTVTDANSCQASASVTINQPTAALSASIVGTDNLCYGSSSGSADLTVTGGNATYTYLWSNAATTEDISSLIAGTYTVTVTDANSCQSTSSVTINQPVAALSASIVGTDNLCYGNSTGSADLTVTGGTATFTYLWSNAATSEDISNLVAGTYTVTVTDANSCQTISSVTINQPSSLLTSTITSTITTCYICSDGTATVSVSGGTPTYTYSWSNGGSTASITACAGTYSVTITDYNGCSTINSVTIGYPHFIDLGITKLLTDPNPLINDSIFKNDTVTFTIVLTNYSPYFNASNIFVSDNLPVELTYVSSIASNGNYNHTTGFWTLPMLNALGTATLTIKAIVDTSTVNDVYIIGYDQPDSNLNNNHAFASVSISSSSGGDDGGLESNGNMASKVALRNFIRHKDNSSKYNDLSKLELFNPASIVTAKAKSTQSTDLANFIPQLGPTGVPALITTPTDLIGISNAIEVVAVDYFDVYKRKAAILGIASNVGTVYEHTKMVCDRLDGGKLHKIDVIAIKGHPFIIAGITQDNGYTDWAVSFIAYKNGNTYTIDNQWDLNKYQPTGNHAVMNYQVWSINEQQTIDLVNKIIDNMTTLGYNVNYVNSNSAYPEFPLVYVENGTYRNGNLEMNLINTNGANTISIDGTKAFVEDGIRSPFNYSAPVSVNYKSSISVPAGNIFDCGFNLNNNISAAKDVLYFADGPWGKDYDEAGASISDFSISTQINPPVAGAFNLGRNANLEGSVKSYASLFRVLRVGNKAVNLSNYNTLEFTAFGTGSYDVVISKAGITNWSNQYRTTINLTNNTPVNFAIPYSQFVNAQGLHNLNANDAVAVVFTKKGNNSSYQNFTINVKNMRFTNSTNGINTHSSNKLSLNVYPNPLISNMIVSFELPDNENVKIGLYSLEGKLIRIIEDKFFNKGINTINLNANDLNQGIYFIKLDAGNYNATEKVIITK